MYTTRTTYTSCRKTKRKTKNGDLVHRQIVSYRQSIVVFVHRHTRHNYKWHSYQSDIMFLVLCDKLYGHCVIDSRGQQSGRVRHGAPLRITAHLLRVICPIIIYLLMDLRSFLLWHQRKGKIILLFHEAEWRRQRSEWGNKCHVSRRKTNDGKKNAE